MPERVFFCSLAEMYQLFIRTFRETGVSFTEEENVTFKANAKYRNARIAPATFTCPSENTEITASHWRMQKQIGFLSHADYSTPFFMRQVIANDSQLENPSAN